MHEMLIMDGRDICLVPQSSCNIVLEAQMFNVDYRRRRHGHTELENAKNKKVKHFMLNRPRCMDSGLKDK